MTDYAVFWGCTIQARFPFMEKSVRLIADTLDIGLHEIEGTTCCPTKLVKIGDEFAWYATAARNLCLAENMGMDLVTPCNGCYGTLKSAASELNLNTKLRNEVNELLATIGLEYRGTVEVKHLIEGTCLAAQLRPHHPETVESLLRPRCQHGHEPLMN